MATPDIQKQFTDICKPKPGTKLAQSMCLSCHVKMGDKKLNSFGLDVKAEMGKQKSKAFTAAVWNKVGARDSNRDGVSNKAAVGKGTLPGDPKSKA